MFETEYKQMMDNIAPSTALISDTLAKAQMAQQSKRPVRRVRGSIILASILILGLVGATAIALTPPKIVDWFGKAVPGHPQAWYTKNINEDEEYKTISSMMQYAPENEMWSVDSSGSNGGMTHDPSKFFASFEEMTQYIHEADNSILVPKSIPEGYRYVGGNVVFFASYKTLRAGMKQLPTQTLANGTTIRKWQAAGSFQNDIRFYHIGLRDDKDNILDVFFRREEAAAMNSTRFLVREGGSSETLEFPGMERSLYVNIPTEHYNHVLHLLRAEAQQKVWYEWCLVQDFDPTISMPYDGELKRTYDYAEYSICSTALGKDQLIKIAESLR